MKSFSNKYIFFFSTVMVVIVAALLAFVAIKLKPKQTENIEIEKMQNILTSVHIESTKKNAKEQFNKYIAESYVIDLDGKKVDNVKAFNVDLKAQRNFIEEIKSLQSQLKEKRTSPFKKFISNIFGSKETDLNAVKTQIQKAAKNRELPVYVCSHENGNTYYVFPVRGKGLWGPIWGYVSFESDMNTIYGAVFDHKSETPGLGAEIKQEWFESSFEGKKIFAENGEFKSVEVVKAGKAAPSQYNVDAISGGTITSKGLEAMLYDCLGSYKKFMTDNKN